MNGTVLAETITPDYFTRCGDYKRFWVSWLNRHIRVGRGFAWDNEMVEYADYNGTYGTSVHGLSFASPSSVYWRTDQQSGSSLGI